MTSISLANDNYVSIKIDENNPLNDVSKLISVIKPSWRPENITYKIFTDGITNKLIGCFYNSNTNSSDNVVLVRIYGNKTDLLIDRKAELRNIKILHKAGLAPQVYGVFENGLAYQYYPGKTLSVDTVQNPGIWPLVATQMAKMHKVELSPEVPKEPILWNKIEQFLSLLPEPFTDPIKQKRFVNSFGSVTKLRIEYERLKLHLSKVESPIVFAHNDLLLGNVIYNQDEDSISFIDYEYATNNYQAYDIANHFNEFIGISPEDIDFSRFPSKTFRKLWIQKYLAEYLGDDKPDDALIEKLYVDVQQMSLASHFLWGVWSLVQFELSNIDYDFGKYAEIRLNKYYELKDKVFKKTKTEL